MSMNLFYFVISLLFPFHFCNSTEHDTKIYYRSLYGGETTYIINPGAHATFNESKEWCDSLGGTLPIIKTQADLDFLTETVIQQGSPGKGSATWMGLTPTSHSELCSPWLDGSAMTFRLEFFGKQSCANCQSRSCCALSVFSHVPEFKKMFYYDCHHRMRKVCILPRRVCVKDMTSDMPSCLTTVSFDVTSKDIQDEPHPSIDSNGTTNTPPIQSPPSSRSSCNCILTMTFCFLTIILLVGVAFVAFKQNVIQINWSQKWESRGNESSFNPDRTNDAKKQKEKLNENEDYSEVNVSNHSNIYEAPFGIDCQ